MPYKDFVRVYDERRVLSMSDKVEPCLIAKPVLSFDRVCNCDLCNPRTEEELASLRWEQKAYQDCMEKQRDIFTVDRLKIIMS